MSDKKVLVWDIESSGLVADFATILCIGYKFLDETKTHVLSITDYPQFEKDPTNDKQLIKDFLKVYTSADLTVAYNGVLFDRPMLYAKIMEHKLPIPPNIPLQDPYFCVKSNLRISRKSLQNVGYFLELSNEKTPVEGRIWKRASAGHRPSIEYIKRHCIADVKVLEECYLALRPLMRSHFRLSEDLGHCRFCNSDHLQSRGRAVSKLKGIQRRVQCIECGGWDQRSDKEVTKYDL
jgi:DNA polymerase elongation subunit (family B)